MPGNGPSINKQANRQKFSYLETLRSESTLSAPMGAEESLGEASLTSASDSASETT